MVLTCCEGRVTESVHCGHAVPCLQIQVVQRLMEMGFSEEASRKALEESSWDETAAINALLSG